jgi:N6-adenosine-specific RNA methylase IME4
MYDVILCDPPWSYRKGSVSPSRDVSNKYETMKQYDLCRLQVDKIANENSLLFLWATCPMIPEAIEVMNAWEFTYKTVAFNWIKRNKKALSLFWGCGSWTRANSELCLLGVRGKPKRNSASVHQVVYEPVSIHSRKPDEVHKRILELCGDVPRVELFATQKVSGWDCAGYDIGVGVENFIANVSGIKQESGYSQIALPEIITVGAYE